MVDDLLMPTSKECNRCLTIGIHSRLKRVYYRLDGKYSEVGWICPSCLRFYLDYDSYIEDYNRIFGTDYTVDKFKEQVWWINERISIEDVFNRKKKKKLEKLELESHQENENILDIK